MADRSPIGRRARRSRRPRHGGGSGDAARGDRCDMCGCDVLVDAAGRCPLGHLVVPPEVMARRAGSDGAAASPHQGSPPAADLGARERAGLPATAPAAFSAPAPPVRGSGADPDDPDVVASYEEPTPSVGRLGEGDEPLPRRPVTRHDHAAPPPSWLTLGRPLVDALPVMEPIPDPPTVDPPTTGPSTTDPSTGDLPLRIPSRLRTPLEPAAPDLFDQAYGDDPDALARQQAADAQAFARIVRPAPEEGTTPTTPDGPTAPPTPAAPTPAAPPTAELPPQPAPDVPADEPAPRTAMDVDGAAATAPIGRAAVGITDLTPAAASVLDAVPEPAPSAVPEPAADAGPEGWEEDDVEVLPPRGVVQRIAAVAFLGVLIAIAWYLAVTI